MDLYGREAARSAIARLFDVVSIEDRPDGGFRIEFSSPRGLRDMIDIGSVLVGIANGCLGSKQQCKMVNFDRSQKTSDWLELIVSETSRR